MVVQAGDALLHYRLLDTIGGGGGGVVWRALDTRLGREVAVKLLPERLSADTEALARLEREARLIAALDHPGIVTLFSVEADGPTRFLTMELVRGETLDRLIPEGGLPLGRLLDLAVPLVDAVAAAHERGITHRDLKPRNVMITPEGRPKVLDFGLAHFGPRPLAPADDSLATLTQSHPGRLVGTLPYMSPEQIRGGAADPRSDVFSLGIMLYEMATGRRPFASDEPAELIASILRDPAPPPEALRAEMPPALARVIESCLEKDPGQRFPSTVALRDALEDIRRGKAPAPSAPRAFGPSVAVLPFADLSREKDQEYFCDGIAEEVIVTLTRIAGLRVASRTSCFLYKKAALDTREIARRLRVSAVLEGSVRTAGDRLRVTAELTDAGSGYHLWSESYDRELRDVFAIQEEIAESIARALEVTLGPGERQALRKAPTRDVEAFDYYLRGRRYYFEYRRTGVEFALEMFGHAIEIDPAYARAHAGIADCSSYLYLYAGHHPEHRDRALESSRRALDLDAGLAQAHVSRGAALTLLDADAEAEAQFLEAQRLDPALFEGAYFHARHCFAQGRLEEAARLFEKAADLERDDYQATLLVGQVYDSLKRPEEAASARRRGLERAEWRLRLNPDDVRARYMGANALVALGERARGLEWARAARALDPDEPMLLYNVACIYALAGALDEALDCAERAVRAGLTEKGWFANDSNLDPLRGHPRFQALLDTLP